MISIKKHTATVWRLPLAVPELVTAMDTMLVAINRSGTDVELTLTDDSGIAQLNQSFLGCHGPTNILSFPAEEDGQGPTLGWLALSLDTLEREILLYGQDPVEHTLRLVAHGLLHLAGYDHSDEMFTLTDIAVNAALPREKKVL